MNRFEEHQTPRQDENIDTLLRAYFQAQMPKPWPGFQPSRKEAVRPVAASQPSRFILSSKFALALSLGLLMLCGWLLSGNGVSPRKVGAPPEISGRPDANRDKNKPIPLHKGQDGREQNEDPDPGLDLIPDR